MRWLTLQAAASCEQVTRALTRFADVAVAGALNWLLEEAVEAGEFTAKGQPRQMATRFWPSELRSRQLNYSSDIDLIIYKIPKKFR